MNLATVLRILGLMLMMFSLSMLPLGDGLTLPAGSVRDVNFAKQIGAR